MAWEKLPTAHRKHKMAYVSITSQGIGISKSFMEEFGISKHSMIDVLIDQKNKLLGFKILERDNEGGMNISLFSTNTHGITSQKVKEYFPECVGKRFWAKWNDNERLIIAELTQPIT